MFKYFHQISEPDERCEALRVINADGSARPYLLKDHYEGIAAIDVPAAAPDSVRRMFDRARQAYLYAWFDYELTSLAGNSGDIA